MSAAAPARRRLLVPEVVQTSAMDCGPAVLACLLRGFGIPADYGRLRETCQTDVDGTSIDALEEAARGMGLAAEQVMLPVDHLLLGEADALPAIVVTLQPGGLTHFVLVWRRHGPLVQVMDPAVGRRWRPAAAFLRDVYVHAHPVPAGVWRDWAGSEGFTKPMRRRLARLGAGRSQAARWLAEATAAQEWRPLARLDAAARLAAALVQEGGVRAGREACAVVEQFRRPPEGEAAGEVIPEAFWSARSGPAGAEGEEQVFLCGAVLVRVTGRTAPAAEGPAAAPGLAAALAPEPARPWRRLRDLGGMPRLAGTAVLAGGLVFLAALGVLEGVLLRGALDVGRELRLPEQRLAAVAALVALGLVLLTVEWRLTARLLQLGRRLEVTLRLCLLERLPRIHDRYFHSRPVSDMADRAHLLFEVRLFPRLAGQVVQTAAGLALTALAVAWLDPGGAALAVAAAVLAVLVPLIANPVLAGLDLRLRTHAGALNQFALDAFLGLTAVRAHGAERSLLREHEALLTDWARAGRRLLRAAVVAETVQLTAGYGLAALLLVRHAGHFTEATAVLLLAWWSLQLPLLGQDLALLARQYPLHRNLTLRLLELLGAPEAAGDARQSEAAPVPGAAGAAVVFEGVAVRAGGHVVLQDVGLSLAAGEHVAVVGESGSGKSTLLGVLLGWHEAAEGRVLVDGEPLDAARLGRLREETAWVDPAVQLWNRTLLDNLMYGAPAGVSAGLEGVLGGAGLHEVLGRLPEGLQTRLGEGGGLVSGGEGQRVRVGRGLARRGARLVLLDEPFRGLDREHRHALLARARAAWPGATLVCVTHDVGETRAFPRVLVLEGGRVVEDGPPEVLLADPGSRYAALARAEEQVRAELWGSPVWRTLHLRDGRLEGPP